MPIYHIDKYDFPIGPTAVLAHSLEEAIAKQTSENSEKYREVVGAHNSSNIWLGCIPFRLSANNFLNVRVRMDRVSDDEHEIKFPLLGEKIVTFVSDEIMGLYQHAPSYYSTFDNVSVDDKKSVMRLLHMSTQYPLTSQGWGFFDEADYLQYEMSK